MTIDSKLHTNFGDLLFSKVLENSIYNHVIDFVEHNNILYDYQYGFRKHNSTKHAIITLM